MTKSIALHRIASYSPARIAELQRRTEDDLAPFMAAVAPVIEQVKQRGDAALIDYARQFDKADLTGKSLLASKGEIDAAFDKLDPELINALEYAADNIRRFHEKQKPPAEWRMEIRPGIEKSVPFLFFPLPWTIQATGQASTQSAFPSQTSVTME